MSNLHIEDFIEGIESTIKQASNPFDINQGALFPNSSSQAKWKFSQGKNKLKLHDGNNVYHFSIPMGMKTDTDFELHRENDLGTHQFKDEGEEEGTAQIHRSDPGSIYFTMQKGKENPTFTIKHMQGNVWKGIPKKKKNLMVKNVEFQGFKAGMEEALEKKSGALEGGLQKAIDTAKNISLFPGDIAVSHNNLNQPRSLIERFLPLGLAGAGAGGLYHLARKGIYNTDEENQEEKDQGIGLLLKRMGIPAAALMGLGAAENSLLTSVDPMTQEATGPLMDRQRNIKEYYELENPTKP